MHVKIKSLVISKTVRFTTGAKKENQMAFKPITFGESNRTLIGSTSDVKPLPTRYDGTCCLSCWRIPFLHRIKMVFTGKVWLCVKGATSPPVWIDSTGFQKKIKP